MESKKHNACKYVLHLVFQIDWKLMPKTITCDFEKPFLKDIKEEYGKDEIYIKCCEFHWKQALRRKLMDFGIPEKKSQILLGKAKRLQFFKLFQSMKLSRKEHHLSVA
jgi:hypothetical protein